MVSLLLQDHHKALEFYSIMATDNIVYSRQLVDALLARHVAQ